MDVPFAPLPLGAIRPEGWLRAQLVLQAENLGDALPLAAALPLGYLLGDDQWIDASHKRIEKAMETQREDGCLPPMEDSDEAWCARAGLMQVLQQYYVATADKRALAHMLRYCKYAWERLKEQPLGPKAAARAGELLQPALWLYRVTEKRFLLELAHVLRAQCVDWTAFCHTTPYKKPLSWEAIREGMLDGDPYHTQVYQQTHAMNLAMGLKTPGLIAQFTGGIKHTEAFDIGYAKLMRHHGFPNGLFSGDDLLSGASPSRGTMSGAVGALMSTLESLLISLGTASHGDVLEKLAFNALPAAYTTDMRAWQRLQRPNQIDADRIAFSSDLADADLTSLHHGFPRFAASLWMASKDGGLAAMSYAPCSVRARTAGGAVRIDVQSAYPFDGSVALHVHVRQEAAFPLHLRIPGWAQGATLAVGEERFDCKPNSFVVLNRTWRPGDTVTLHLPMEVVQSEWYYRTVALSRGPLLLAHAIDAGLPWAYALLPNQACTVQYDPAQAASFGYGSPLIVEAKAVLLPGWKAKQGVAEAPPIAPEVDAAQAISLPLIPYGSTILRVCQFPMAILSD